MGTMDTPSLHTTTASSSTLDMLEARRGIDEKKEDPTLRARRAGLDELATHMLSTPNRSGALFRRFDALNLRELLEMEREIAEQEDEILALEAQRVVDRDAMWRMKRELRRAMREYYESLLLTSSLTHLPRPPFPILNRTRQTFPPSHPHLPRYLLDKYHNPTNYPDLASLAAPAPPDALTRLASSGPKSAHAVTLLSALCAVLFLVGGMVGLYFVESMRARLGLVGMFTVLFAGVIAGGTGGRRTEVFVATAAYAAVLVVFVSGNLSSNPAPAYCVLAPSGGAGVGAADVSAAAVANTAVGTAAGTAVGATVTAVMTETLTFSEAGSTGTLVSTVFDTVTSIVSSSPSVIVKKGDLSGLAKTGIGVGATLGTLFLLMLIGGFVMWVRRQIWFEEGGVFGVRSKWRKERGFGGKSQTGKSGSGWSWKGFGRGRRDGNKKGGGRKHGTHIPRMAREMESETAMEKEKESVSIKPKKDEHTEWV